MENIVINRIKKYMAEKALNEVNASREVMQEITLFALSKTDFFDRVSFCGGTCLRIAYNLNRASEDLDFSIIEPDSAFEINKYFTSIKNVFSMFGIEVEINEKSSAAVKSAFLKNNTILKEIVINPKGHIETLRVKLEIDSNPPLGAKREYKYGLFPASYRFTCHDLATLSSGKLHAILSRNWTKGRDYFDYLFYIEHDSDINLTFLNNALIQTGNLDKSVTLTYELLEKMLIERFEKVDFEEAKKDCERFISDRSVLDNFNQDFFIGITKQYFNKYR